ncbi:MAG: NlpC/P60 family protein, partial [Lachnospiraceae bacterium]
ELNEKYHLTFSEDFAVIMNEIESEYRVLHGLETEEESQKILDMQAAKALVGTMDFKGNKGLSDVAEKSEEAVKEEPEMLKAGNWQDILAIYVLQQSRQGKTEYVLNADSKKELMIIYTGLNQLTEKEGKTVYSNLHVSDYIERNRSQLSESDLVLLGQMVSSDCSLLCSAATGSEGFIMQSLGDQVSKERARVVAAAYSLVGKVSYFWGGKSFSFGWDNRWGQSSVISATGSTDSGQVKSYGLDCSGYVSWAFINGFGDQLSGSKVGQGTASQWSQSKEVQEAEAVPGDLVFLQPPSAGGINHVGIVVGRSESGDLIAAHCNASDNGVVVESAYSAGFRYVRRPVCLEEMTE